MMIMTEFDFFETVYLKTDTEQLARMITNININPVSGTIYQVVYTVACGTLTSLHYEGEMSRERVVGIIT